MSYMIHRYMPFVSGETAHFENTVLTLKKKRSSSYSDWNEDFNWVATAITEPYKYATESNTKLAYTKQSSFVSQN